MSFICMLLFLVLSLLAFCKSSEKNDKTIQTTKKTQVPFAFVVVLLQVMSWTIDSISLHPPIPIILRAIQPLAQSPPIHPSRETRERDCPDPREVLRYTYFYFKSQCKFHLLKNVIDTSSSPPLSSLANNFTSL